MLVPHGCTGRGVTETPHQLGKGRAGLSGEHGSGVAKVVLAEILATGSLPSRVVDLVERRGGHVRIAVNRR